MPADPSPPADDRLTPLQVLTLILSIVVLLLMLVEATFKLNPAQQRAVDACDVVICFVFLLDFGTRFQRATDKRAFMKWGWIDLLSSIPVIDAFRWGRLVRIVRVLRLFRAFRSTRTLLLHFLHRERLGSVGSVVAIFALIVSFAAITVLYVETEDPTSTIKTPGDAFWWAIVTVTTVGYGDHLPSTPEGRTIAGLLMVAGVGLFGTLSGLVASLLVNPGVRHEETEITALAVEIRRLREQIDRLEAGLPSRPPRVTHAADEDAPPV
jgi:voltage-gated potassium channel